ncbi:lytic murein transglycosylase [Salaquimonas pukyongi]|uniref:lytic murein transglycosylase n=1 Tax=Salaquimonas pukyongi TaxID=2712698 RepID=UPI00096B7338
MRRVSHILTGALAALLVAAPVVLAMDKASIDRQFRQWLQNDLWPQARSNGISPATFKAAFNGVTPNLKLPDLILPGSGKKLDRKQWQAEFRAPSAYFAENIIGAVASGGSKLLARHAALLARLEGQTGVPGRIVVAIWGRESAFGKAKIPYNAFEVLGTKAFMATRKDYFRAEVLAALEMVERRGAPARGLKGSWAGALGQPQFMPSSFLAHARDGDGDGKADIWNSVNDTLSSIAGYLSDKGWVRGRDWGFEVTVPQSVSCALEGPDQGRKIADWARLGIRRANGKPFPAHEAKQQGYLMMPAGRYGPAFIVTPNFYVLKEYNESDLYALFVGHAGDRMQYGSPPFQAGWQQVDDLLRSDIAAMQRGLEKLGYDVGGADGLPGFRTRRSIGGWQAKQGMTPTCFPSRKLVNRLG